MKDVTIYTDGACRGNPGPGGWGVILVYRGIEKEMSGGEKNTTNNRMELMAVIEGLSALKMKCRVALYSDSQYVVNAINEGWAVQWQKTNWKNGKAKNPDLWERVLSLCEEHEVTFHWVRGHDGHSYNERCDVLATTAADALAD
ncbi:MAG: ribonuclease HI [Clostridia bacterium]|nr:ribonuclease HI [Clostridia bacterium]